MYETRNPYAETIRNAENLQASLHNICTDFYAETIRNAENLQASLHNICTDFELALEQRQLSIQAYTTARQAYEEQEAEFLFELSLTDEYQKGKNAEIRKMLQDVALIKARNNGPLRMAWGALNQATNVRDNAELAYSQMDARFKAVRVAAELQASMLRAAALG